jgi:hypothetical protein
MPTFAAPRAKHNSQDDYDEKTDQNDDEVTLKQKIIEEKKKDI